MYHQFHSLFGADSELERNLSATFDHGRLQGKIEKSVPRFPGHGIMLDTGSKSLKISMHEKK